jgi:soluble lytic murein transglycosylase-like protein
MALLLTFGARPGLAARALGASVCLACAGPALAQPVALGSAPVLTLESLPRPSAPPPERNAVVPSQVLRWRQEAQAYEHGEQGHVRDAVRAAEMYCRASRFGDAESQFNLGWMLAHARGIERNDAHAAHLFAAAAEQGHPQAANMAQRLGEPLGDPPACLQSPDEPAPAAAAAAALAAPAPVGQPGKVTVMMQSGQLVIIRPPEPKPVAQATQAPAAMPLPPNAPEVIVNFVRIVAPEYKLDPALVLAVMATESNFNPIAVSPRNAQGLMQLIPDTARRFNVRNIMDPAQNIRGGMAYLRWLLAYYQGDVALALAGYNAGEGAVDRYRGVPPYAETRNYVARIIDRLGGQRRHPFDGKVASPSQRLAALGADTARR